MADRKVDYSTLKVNQAFIIALLTIAFVISSSWLVVFVAAVMLVGTAAPSLSLFKQIYLHILRPAGLVKPTSSSTTRNLTALPKALAGSCCWGHCRASLPP